MIKIAKDNLPIVYYCKRCDRFTDVRYVTDIFGGRNKSYCYNCGEEMLQACEVQVIK